MYWGVFMSKWRVFVELVIITNLLMCVGYVLAGNYVMDYFRTELTVENGLSVINKDVFHIEIVHPIISDGQILYPPTKIGNGIWNYPFILFWVMLATNLSFIVWLYRSKEKKQNTSWCSIRISLDS